MMYGIKWELKNYDNLSEEEKRYNDRFHSDRKLNGSGLRTFKTKEAAERQVARYRSLNNEEWEITVIEM